jgi:hypothetical protein
MNDKIKNVTWTNSEVDLLKQIYTNAQNENVSRQMGRSIASISSKASSLGLKKSLDFKRKLTAARNKSVGRDLTFDALKKIASKYKSRGEFQSKDGSAYSTARRDGYLSEICHHMINTTFSIPQLILQDIMDTLLKSQSLYNTRKIIPPYEIDIYYPEFRLALEYNGRRWHFNNKRDIIKNILFEEQSINVVYIVENNRKYEEDIKSQIIKNLDQINNICHTNVSDKDIINYQIKNVYSKIYNAKDMLNIAQNYSSFQLFKQEKKNIYVKLCKLKLIDRATCHMKDKRHAHTISEVTSAASKYTTLKDFLLHESPIYQYISRNKLWNLIRHMKSDHRWKSTLSS